MDALEGFFEGREISREDMKRKNHIFRRDCLRAFGSLGDPFCGEMLRAPDRAEDNCAFSERELIIA